MKHVVGVFSGLVFSGKTWWLERIMQLSQFAGAPRLQMDLIRRKLWGSKVLTPLEHRFKNEVVRQELMRLLIIQGPPLVFMEAVMLTRKYHQLPLVTTIERLRHEYLLDDAVHLRVVLFYCSLAVVGRRIESRREQIAREGNVHSVDVFDFDGYLDGARQIEVPMDYELLPVNTSDESLVAVQRSQEEIVAFLGGGDPITKAEHSARIAEYESILCEVRRT